MTKRTTAPDSGNDVRQPISSSLPEKPRGFLPFMTRPLLFVNLFATDQLIGMVSRPVNAEEVPEAKRSSVAPEAGSEEAKNVREPSSTISDLDEPLQTAYESGSETSSRSISNAPATTAPDSAGTPRLIFGSAEERDVGAARGAGGGDGGSNAEHASAQTLASATEGPHGTSGNLTVRGDIEVLDTAPSAEPLALSEAPRLSSSVYDTSVGADNGVEMLEPVAHIDGPTLAPGDTATNIASDVLTTAESPIGAVALALAAAAGTPGLIHDVLDTSEPLVDAIATKLAVADAAVELSYDVLAAAEPILDNVTGTIRIATEATTGLAGDVLDSAEPIAGAISPTLTTVTNTATHLAGDVLDSARPIVENIAPALASVTETVTEPADQALAIAEPIIGTVTGTITTATNTATGLAGDVLDAAQPSIGAISPTLTTVTNTASDLADEALDSTRPIVENIAPALASVTETVPEPADQALAIAEPIIGTVTGTITTATNSATGFAGDLLNTAEPVVDSNSPTLAIVTDQATNLAGVVGSPQPIVDSLAQPLEAVIGKASGPSHDVTEPATGAVAPAVATVTNKASDLAGDGVDSPQPIVDAVAPQLADAPSVAADLGDGVLKASEPMLKSVAPTLGSSVDLENHSTSDSRDTAEPVAGTMAPPRVVPTNTASDLAHDVLETSKALVDDAAAPTLSADNNTEPSDDEDVLASAIDVVEPLTPALATTDAAPAVGSELPTADPTAEAMSSGSPAELEGIVKLEAAADDGGSTGTPPAAPSMEQSGAASLVRVIESEIEAPVKAMNSEKEMAESAKAIPLAEGDDFLGSPGTIVLDDPPSPSPSDGGADATFADGRYTDYGVALSGTEDAPGAPPTGDSSGAPIAAQEQPTDAVKPFAEEVPPTASLVAELTSLSDSGPRSDDGLI